jgi:hypothetical protein
MPSPQEQMPPPQSLGQLAEFSQPASQKPSPQKQG